MQHVDEYTQGLLTLEDLAKRWQAPENLSPVKRKEWTRRRCQAWGVRPLGGWVQRATARFRLASVIQAEQRAEKM